MSEKKVSACVTDSAVIPTCSPQATIMSVPYCFWKRLFDILLATTGLLILAFPMIVIALGIKLTSRGPVLHWSKRIGRHNSVFWMPKFRSMRIDTPQLATHLLRNADEYVTGVGKFLRKTSLDELPQLFSIVRGDLSVVGPRPALFNQDDLISLRTQHSIHFLKPGLTGWAQVNGRDELNIEQKVRFDHEYLLRWSFVFDLRIMILTFCKAFVGSGISH